MPCTAVAFFKSLDGTIGFSRPENKMGASYINQHILIIFKYLKYPVPVYSYINQIMNLNPQLLTQMATLIIKGHCIDTLLKSEGTE